MTRARDFANFGSDAPSAIGTAGQALLVNSGATAYEWAEAGGGATEFIASSGAISSGTANVSFTQFDASKYDYYKFAFHSVIPLTDNQELLGQLSANGTSYDSTNGSYHSNGTTDKTGLTISYYGVGAESGELIGFNGEALIFNAGSTTRPTVSLAYGASQYPNGTDNVTGGSNSGNFYQASTVAHTAIRFLFTSGNINSGEIVMYGIKNS